MPEKFPFAIAHSLCPEAIDPNIGAPFVKACMAEAEKIRGNAAAISSLVAELLAAKAELCQCRDYIEAAEAALPRVSEADRAEAYAALFRLTEKRAGLEEKFWNAEATLSFLQ